MIIGLCSKMPGPWYAEFEGSADRMGLQCRTIEIGDDDWVERLRGVDVFVWRLVMSDPTHMAEARTKIPLIEAMGITCFPDSRMLWLYDDKIRETFFLRSQGCPVPRTWVFFDEAQARHFAEGAEYPLVAKSHCGASAGGVARLDSRAQAMRMLDRIFKGRSLWQDCLEKFYYLPRLAKGDPVLQLNARYRDAWPRYAYFQEFLRVERDWRITTLGGDLVSVFSRRNRPGDFRASGSGLWEKAGPSHLPADACDLALRISRANGFTSMTYDFMQKDGGWVIGEISYTFLLNAVYSDSLFLREAGGFVPSGSIPIGEMHLKALLERRGDHCHV